MHIQSFVVGSQAYLPVTSTEAGSARKTLLTDFSRTTPRNHWIGTQHMPSKQVHDREPDQILNIHARKCARL